MSRGEGGYGHSVGRLLEELRPQPGRGATGAPGSPHPHVWKVITKAEAAKAVKPAYVGAAGSVHRVFRSTELWATIVISLLFILLLILI